MSVEWLKDLEEKVHETARRLEELQSENEELRAQLEKAKSATEGDSAWVEEKQEIQDRVSKLASHLTKLLED